LKKDFHFAEHAAASVPLQPHFQQPYPYYPPPPVDNSSSVVAIIILVVAIIVVVTVVLAAVLYVMVIGFGGDIAYTTPIGAWNNVEATSSTSGTLTFGSFTEVIAPGDLIIYVEKDGISAGYIEMRSPSSQTTALTWSNNPDGSSAIYVDYSYYGGVVNPGDHIELEGLIPNTEYSFSLFHTPTDSLITMTGDPPEFITQP